MNKGTGSRKRKGSRAARTHAVAHCSASLPPLRRCEVMFCSKAGSQKAKQTGTRSTRSRGTYESGIEARSRVAALTAPVTMQAGPSVATDHTSNRSSASRPERLHCRVARLAAGLPRRAPYVVLRSLCTLGLVAITNLDKIKTESEVLPTDALAPVPLPDSQELTQPKHQRTQSRVACFARNTAAYATQLRDKHILHVTPTQSAESDSPYKHFSMASERDGWAVLGVLALAR